MKKYNIIYADPPWEYSDVSSYRIMHGGVNRHYKTMSTYDICSLPIKDLAADDCILFIWVTFPALREVFKVIEAWGFEYKTIGFTWIKMNKKNGKPFFGIGYYTRSNAELCLIATKGKPSKVSKSKKVSSVIISNRRQHSRKPDQARERIIKLCGDVPRIELFARERFSGWDVWGNESPRYIQKTLKEVSK
jgi:site-specific DNA-methyltransferase (adenine-specific)